MGRDAGLEQPAKAQATRAAAKERAIDVKRHASCSNTTSYARAEFSASLVALGPAPSASRLLLSRVRCGEQPPRGRDRSLMPEPRSISAATVDQYTPIRPGFCTTRHDGLSLCDRVPKVGNGGGHSW